MSDETAAMAIPEAVTLPSATLPEGPRWWLLWLGMVVVAVLCQPLLLGFYMDDWGAIVAAAHQGAAFSWKRLRYIYLVDPTRPVAVPIRFLFSSLLGDLPLLWQTALLCASAALVFPLGKILLELNPADGRRWRSAIWPVAACWLTLPWSAGLRFWGVLLPVQVFLVAFALAAWYTIVGWTSGKARLFIPGLLYVIVCLGYEAFYLQFVPLVLIGFALVLAGRAALRHVLATGAVLAAAQVLAFAWYVSTKRLGLEQKPVIADWSGEMYRNMVRLVPELFRSMEEVRWVFAAFAAVAAAVAAVVIIWCWRRPSLRADAQTTSVLILGCLVGAFLSLMVFTAGGRIVSGIGAEGRTFTLVSFWMILGAGILGTFVLRHSTGVARRLFCLAAIGVGFTLLAANGIRTQDWAQAWRAQQKILAEAPVEQMAAAPANATVLYLHPLDVNGAPVFAASWDINHALPLTHPSTAHLYFFIYSPWLGRLVWNGKTLAYENNGPSRPTERLYVWRPVERAFRAVNRPIHVNQNYTIEELLSDPDQVAK